MDNSAAPKMHLHPIQEIATCRTKGHACRLALTHSGIAQDDIVAVLHVTKGHLSNLLSGKRRWVDDVQWRFEQACGSLAPSQWDARRKGLSIYVDQVELRRAQIKAELQRLDEDHVATVPCSTRNASNAALSEAA